MVNAQEVKDMERTPCFAKDVQEIETCTSGSLHKAARPFVLWSTDFRKINLSTKVLGCDGDQVVKQ